jgi:hypothetical protein
VFAAGLTSSLREGRFRLVLVLDEAPPELIRLVGYLEAVADKLVIDLITVAAYETGGTQLVVPQRVDPERGQAPVSSVTETPPRSGFSAPGSELFANSIKDAPADQQAKLLRAVGWATELERQGLVTLWTYQNISGLTTLLPYVPGDEAGLVTVYNDKGTASLRFYRSVFERRAPKALARLEMVPDSPRIGQGTSTSRIDDALLEVLSEAYREAAGGLVELS